MDIMSDIFTSWMYLITLFKSQFFFINSIHSQIIIIHFSQIIFININDDKMFLQLIIVCFNFTAFHEWRVDQLSISASFGRFGSTISSDRPSTKGVNNS